MSSSRTGRMQISFVVRRAGEMRGIPGPLTFRMMERVVSSINSTRTWVTPPREPGFQAHQHLRGLEASFRRAGRTGSAEDSGDLDELDGSLRGIHFRD